MTSKLRQNAAVLFFINRQNNSNKIVYVLPENNANKNVAFLNELSVHNLHTYVRSIARLMCIG